ncbi:hypothetical protein RhiirC2_782881 [Rhizophagus irregularis]|uniref:Uncharacterized protein n=1 Tax=Rhizophagus irregularis TaxID=588596 RepID=A0A2N1N267_9GLOM|nr:hypothetical protein RhiirC2_782881 [Rhizophagus irregularis]
MSYVIYVRDTSRACDDDQSENFDWSSNDKIDCHYDNNELNFMNEQNVLSNSFCPQQVNVLAAVSFSENSEILSSPQNFEFYDNNYNVHEI